MAASGMTEPIEPGGEGRPPPPGIPDILLASAIVDQAQDAIIAKDLDGHIIAWNEGAERMYGYRPAEVIGKPISILGRPGKWFEVLALIHRVADGERIEHYETSRTRRDGTDLRVSISLSPIRDASGRVVGVVTIERDVSVRALASRGVREPMPPDPRAVVIDKDLSGNIQRWSPGAEALYGYTAEEAVGQPIAILMPRDHQNEMMDLIEAVRTGKQVEGHRTRRVGKDGRELATRITLTPLTDADGRLIGVRSIASVDAGLEAPPATGALAAP